MDSATLERVWTADTYLTWEMDQPYKYELLDGRLFEMPGVSRYHNRIARNLIVQLDSKIARQGCEVFFSELRIQAEADNTYTYPDVVVVCGAPRFRQFADSDTLENPLLIFEILSPSTEANDRGVKRDKYLRLESLAGYYLVSQDEPRIEALERDGAEWRETVRQSLDATLELAAIDCALPLRDIYFKVGFTDATGG